MSLYSTCTYLHLIIVFLQQCCMSGTSEVHCGGLSLKRSARGAGWVVCVCANVWSLLESIGYVLIYVDEGAMDWFRAWVTSSQETRELHRDLEERSKTQALSLFEHARAPSRSADDYRWLMRSIVAEVFDLKLWIVGQSLRRKSCRAARGTYWVSYCTDWHFLPVLCFAAPCPYCLLRAVWHVRLRQGILKDHGRSIASLCAPGGNCACDPPVSNPCRLRRLEQIWYVESHPVWDLGRLASKFVILL